MTSESIGREIGAFLRGLLSPSADPGTKVFERSTQAEHEVEAFMDNLYSALNQFSEESQGSIVDGVAEEMLPIYEVFASANLVEVGGSPEVTATPVTLRNKNDVARFFSTWEGLVANAKASQQGSYIGEPLFYANDTMAVFTEDCEVKTTREDGTTVVSPLRGTGVLRKGADGWKLVHWHISSAEIATITPDLMASAV